MQYIRGTSASLILLLTCLIMTTAVRAALAPGHVKQRQDAAPELLEITILTVTMGKKHGETQDVTYTAKVVSVERSAADFKPGDVVRIRGYIRNPDHTGLPKPGPKFPELLNKGWTGVAFLDLAPDSKDLTLAVFGHSFVEKKRE